MIFKSICIVKFIIFYLIYFYIIKKYKINKLIYKLYNSILEENHFINSINDETYYGQYIEFD